VHILLAVVTKDPRSDEVIDVDGVWPSDLSPMRSCAEQDPV
jgi:hypothetical protein